LGSAEPFAQLVNGAHAGRIVQHEHNAHRGSLPNQGHLAWYHWASKGKHYRGNECHPHG
jgi:poly(3-hydroxyalkanoate) synthetase